MGYMEEGDNRIAFMYRLVKGSAKRSFGLNVALLAKLPQQLVDRAAHMSGRFEAQVTSCCYISAEALQRLVRHLSWRARSCFALAWLVVVTLSCRSLF